MKRFFTALITFLFIATLASCGSSQPKQQRQPRQAKQSNYQSNYSQPASRPQDKTITVSENRASVRSGYPEIWVRPVEFGYKIKENVGKNGRIDIVFPKDEEDLIKVQQYTSVYYNSGRVPAYGVGQQNNTQQNTNKSSRNMDFEDLSPLAKAAILSIIKDYNLDGFYFTMIEEFEGKIVVNRETGRSKKLKDGGSLNEIETQTTTMKQVRIRGIALQLEPFGLVNEERSDAVRKEEAGAPTYIFR
ncbi:hypothetical protein J5690_09905 [bacterium]|nr:hypothetical protein [bacterium]